jgi:hypothetical protein
MRGRGFGLLLAAILLSGVFGWGTATTAQVADEGFPFGAAAAICPDEDYLGPFVGCEPWDGLAVSFVSDDQSFDETCVTSSNPADSPRWASCGLEVPFGSLLTVSIDVSQVPDGYYLFTEPVQEWPIPDGPPEGLFGAANFVIIPEGGGDDREVPADGDDSVLADIAVLPSTGTGAVASAGVARTGLAIMASLLLIMSGTLRRHIVTAPYPACPTSTGLTCR